MDFQDLVYFGHEKGNVDRYCEEIKEAFPNVKLNGTYDIIKGYRQEVFLLETQSDDYFAWLIAYGWGALSMNLTLIAVDKGSVNQVKRYVELAKQQYPHKFKTKE